MKKVAFFSIALLALAALYLFAWPVPINPVAWDAPACDGYDLAYMREHGFAKLKVGTKDDRAPHKNGNFPTPTGKCMFMVEGAKNFVAGPFRQMYEGFQPGEDVSSYWVCQGFYYFVEVDGHGRCSVLYSVISR